MGALEKVYQLLQLALLEIRVAAQEEGAKKYFHLADLFHNVPLQLRRVARGKGTYDEVLAWIQEQALEKGCERWVENALGGSTSQPLFRSRVPRRAT